MLRSCGGLENISTRILKLYQQACLFVVCLIVAAPLRFCDVDRHPGQKLLGLDRAMGLRKFCEKSINTSPSQNDPFHSGLGA
jgi:hypothetical protein